MFKYIGILVLASGLSACSHMNQKTVQNNKFQQKRSIASGGASTMCLDKSGQGYFFRDIGDFNAGLVIWEHGVGTYKVKSYKYSVSKELAVDSQYKDADKSKTSKRELEMMEMNEYMNPPRYTTRGSLSVKYYGEKKRLQELKDLDVVCSSQGIYHE